MITDSYEFLTTARKTRYIFESEGNQGKIIKIVIFTPLEKGEWNLGFGDLREGIIDDSIVSNNQDVFMVMKTIAKIIFVFFQEYPNSIIVIKPVDEKRKRLYNAIFQRHFKDIDPDFNIIGLLENKKNSYSSQINYDSFEISLKFDL
jgi:hypothetical protein